MLKIIKSGCKQHLTDAAADTGTSNNPKMPPWPTPSCKDWLNRATIAIRIAYLLKWLQRPTAEDKEALAAFDTSHSSVLGAATIEPSQYLLLQTLLQISDTLLTGE